MKKRTMLLLAVVALLCSPSFGALNAYITLIGKSQGRIEGSVIQKGREGKIMAIGFTHTFNTEPDPKSCIAGDVRNHFPLTIIKTFDKATNPILRAWADREPLSVIIDFWRPGISGAEEQYFTITLENAFISGIYQEMFNNKNPDNMQYETMERISFTYENIQQNWKPDGGILVQDGWRAQCAKNNVFSDLNFDGVVNLLDFAIMADQWMMQSF
jgi:type VI secretion system secreted protein Hcp